jgi:hypothetical protein
VLEEVIMSWALSAVLLCTCTYLHDGKGTVTVYVGLWSPRGISKHRGRPRGLDVNVWNASSHLP